MYYTLFNFTSGYKFSLPFFQNTKDIFQLPIFIICLIGFMLSSLSAIRQIDLRIHKEFPKKKEKIEETAEKAGEAVGKGVKKGWGIAKGIGKGIVKGVKGEEEKEKKK